MSQRTLIVGSSLLLAVAASGVGVALSLSQRTAVHTPLHIGCRHHNHGPKWHADHGRSLEALRQPRPGRLVAPDNEALQRRSLTAAARASGRSPVTDTD